MQAPQNLAVGSPCGYMTQPASMTGQAAQPLPPFPFTPHANDAPSPMFFGQDGQHQQRQLPQCMPPSDMMACAHAPAQPQGAAYFESCTPTGQLVSGPNPFCM
jgi:hypothetical protein